MHGGLADRPDHFYGTKANLEQVNQPASERHEDLDVTKEKLSELFKKYDLDDAKFLCKKKLKPILDCVYMLDEKKFDADFEVCDEDQDGSLCEVEFFNLMRNKFIDDPQLMAYLGATTIHEACDKMVVNIDKEIKLTNAKFDVCMRDCLTVGSDANNNQQNTQNPTSSNTNIDPMDENAVLMLDEVECFLCLIYDQEINFTEINGWGDQNITKKQLKEKIIKFWDKTLTNYKLRRDKLKDIKEAFCGRMINHDCTVYTYDFNHLDLVQDFMGC